MHASQCPGWDYLVVKYIITTSNFLNHKSIVWLNAHGDPSKTRSCDSGPRRQILFILYVEQLPDPYIAVQRFIISNLCSSELVCTICRLAELERVLSETEAYLTKDLEPERKNLEEKCRFAHSLLVHFWKLRPSKTYIKIFPIIHASFDQDMPFPWGWGVLRVCVFYLKTHLTQLECRPECNIWNLSYWLQAIGERDWRAED